MYIKLSVRLWTELILFRILISELFFFIKRLIRSQSITNKMQRFIMFFISVRRSTCFRRFFRPSSRAQKRKHIQRQVFVRPTLLPAASLAMLAAGNSVGLKNT